MKIEELKEERIDLFREFLLNEQNQLDEDYYEEHYAIRYVLESLNKGQNNYILFFENNKIISFGSISKEFYDKVNIITLYNYNKEIVDLVKANFPDYLLSSARYDDYSKYGYFCCKYESSFNPAWSYHNKAEYYVSSEEKVYVLRDLFEKEYFPELGETEYSLMTKEELQTVLFDCEHDVFDVPIWKRCNILCAGFHYLTPDDVSNSNMKYLTAKIDGKIIGIIKFGLWSRMPNEILVSYIDVCEKYWGNGIASGLIKELNNHLSDKKRIFVTSESHKGKECHMLEKFNKYLSCSIEVV